MAVRIPSYRLHKPSGRAVVTIDGKDVYLGAYDTPESHQRYKRAIAEWLANGARATILPGSAITVSEAIRVYDDHARAYYVKDGKPTKQLERVRRSLALVRDLYGPTEAQALGGIALKTVRARMVDLGWSRGHVNACIGCVKRAWKWLASEELVPASTWHSLQTIEGLRLGRTEAREVAPVKPAPEADVEAALTKLRRAPAAMVRLQLLTGMRPGEVCQFDMGRLDRTSDVWLYRPASHKGQHHGQERIVFVGPRAQELILDYLGGQLRMGPIFSPAEMMAERHADVRAQQNGRGPRSQAKQKKRAARRAPRERYDSNSYAQAVRRACLAASVEPWHPHMLRHNAATRLVEDFGWAIAQIILGHASLDATRLYAEGPVKKAVDAIRKVG